MKKNKSKNFIVRGTIYPFDVMFSVMESDDNFAKALMKYHFEPPVLYSSNDDSSVLKMDDNDSCNGRTFMCQTGQTIIRLKNYPSTPYRQGVLVHEVFHAVYFIFNRIGLELTRDSEEAYAYFIDYLTREFYSNIE